MAKYYIMYWKKIPVQVKATDSDGNVTELLPPRFMEVVDAIAMREGLFGADEYLKAWNWGSEQEHPGTAAEVAQAISIQLDGQFPIHGEELEHFILEHNLA
jgi:hypothetical protein